MAICVYDNPHSMARECWINGKLVCSYSMDIFFIKPPPWMAQPIPGEYLFFPANIGPWQKGRLVGEISAMSGLS